MTVTLTTVHSAINSLEVQIAHQTISTQEPNARYESITKLFHSIKLFSVQPFFMHPFHYYYFFKKRILENPCAVINLIEFEIYYMTHQKITHENFH